MTGLTLVKIARMYQRLTLDDVEFHVGKKVGLSKHAFTRIENGTYTVTITTQKALCKYLGIKRSAAFNANGKAQLIRWKHIQKMEKILDRG